MSSSLDAMWRVSFLFDWDLVWLFSTFWSRFCCRVTIRLFLERSGDRDGDPEESDDDVSPSSLNPAWIALWRRSFRRLFRRTRRPLRGSFMERRTVRIGGGGLLPFGSGTRNSSLSDGAGDEDDDVEVEDEEEDWEDWRKFRPGTALALRGGMLSAGVEGVSKCWMCQLEAAPLSGESQMICKSVDSILITYLGRKSSQQLQDWLQAVVEYDIYLVSEVMNLWCDAWAYFKLLRLGCMSVIHNRLLKMKLLHASVEWFFSFFCFKIKIIIILKI